MQQLTKSFISDRANSVEGSVTIGITSLAKKMKDDGLNVISFSAGEPDFETPQNIKDAGIQAIKDGKTTYTPAAGIIELKQAICNKLLNDQGISYTPDEIVVSCGAKHSIYNALLATINPNDEVLIPAPFWVSYPHQVKLANGTPVIIPTTEATNFKITPEILEQYITPQSKLLILTAPSNPTGAAYTKADLEALSAVILKHQLLVISDEIYEKLVYDCEHTSIASISDEMKNLTILINGVSKAYAMTGWRIGYLAAQKNIVKAVNKIQSHATSNPTTPSQWASIEALNNSEDAINEMRKAFNERRLYMVNTLNQLPGIQCLMPDGAFYAFPNVSSYFGKTAQSGIIKDSFDFCDFLLRETHVACVPGAAFGAEQNIRLSYATSLNDIKEGLNRIETWLQNLK